MNQVPLYTKYRPTCFNDVVEQESIKQILSRELETKKLKQVLLFTGGAGTGKTTSARIFAKEIEPVLSNIIEINCADHTGVEDVRGLILDSVKSKPITGIYKIFILDECHQLTIQSQNALLKVLEEPPKHCIFILCTTDPQKVLPTILSRTFRYDFQLISFQGIVNRLLFILDSEKNDVNGCGVQSWSIDAINYIAQLSEGHMRNAIALLDKTISYDVNITVDSVIKVLGVTGYDKLFTTLESLINKDQAKLLMVIDEVNNSGMDLKLFIKNLLTFVLDVNKYVILRENNCNNIMGNIAIPLNYADKLSYYNSSHKLQLKNLLTCLLELNSSIRWETNVKPVLESNLLLQIL